jgi:hypothetical protein
LAKFPREAPSSHAVLLIGQQHDIPVIRLHETQGALSVGLSDDSYSKSNHLTLNQLVPGSNPGAGILLLLRSRFDSLSVPLRLMFRAGAEP